MSNQSYDFNLSVGIQEILDADSAAKVESQVQKQKQRMEEPVEIKVELNIGDAKAQIKELQKEMTIAANNIQKIKNKKKGLGKSDYNDIAKYNSLLDSNQRKIDGIVAQLKSQGVAVRTTTKEYKALQAVLEEIGYVEKKKKTSAPRKQATNEVKQQTEAEKEHARVAVEVVKATENVEKSAKKATSAVAQFTQQIDKLTKKYGEASFTNIFGGVLSSFSSIDESNAINAYNALIAKDKEYQKELKAENKLREARGREMQAFVNMVNPVESQIAASTEGTKEFAQVMNELSAGSLTAAQAMDRLQKYLGGVNKESANTSGIERQTDAITKLAQAQKELKKAYLDSRKVYEVSYSGTDKKQIFPTKGKAQYSIQNYMGLGGTAEIVEKYLGDVEESLRKEFERIYYQPSVAYKPGKTFTLAHGDLDTYLAMIEEIEDFKSQYNRLSKLRSVGTANIKPNANMLGHFSFLLEESEYTTEAEIELLERILTSRISSSERLNNLLTTGRSDLANNHPGANPNSTFARMYEQYNKTTKIQTDTSNIEKETEAINELAKAQQKLQERQANLQHGNEKDYFRKGGFYSGKKGRLALARNVASDISEFNLSNSDVEKLVASTYDEFSKIKNLLVDRQTWINEIQTALRGSEFTKQLAAQYSTEQINELRRNDDVLAAYEQVRSGALSIEDALEKVKKISSELNAMPKETSAPAIQEETAVIEENTQAVKKNVAAKEELTNIVYQNNAQSAMAAEQGTLAIRNSALAEFDKEKLSDYTVYIPTDEYKAQFSAVYSDLRQKVADGNLSVSQALVELGAEYVRISELVGSEFETLEANIRRMTVDEYKLMRKGVNFDKLFKIWGITRQDDKNAIYDELSKLGDIIISGTGDADAQIANILDKIIEFARIDREEYTFGIAQGLAKELRSYGKILYDDDLKKRIGKAAWSDISQSLKGMLTTSHDASRTKPDQFYESLPEHLQAMIASISTTQGRAEFNASDESILRGIASILDGGRIEKSNRYRALNAEEIASLSEEASALIIQTVNNVENLVAKEKELTSAAEHTNEVKRKSVEIGKEAAAGVKQQLASELSIEDLVRQDLDAAFAKLRSSKDNATTLFNLKGVFNGGDLVSEARSMIDKIAEQGNLKVGLFDVDDAKGAIHVQLYNEALKVTVDQTYKLRAATEETAASLELVGNKYRQNVKSLNSTGKFDLDAAKMMAAAEMRAIKAKLSGTPYEGMAQLEGKYNNIVDAKSVEEFNTHLKIAQKEVSALLAEMARGTRSFNDFARVETVMRNANEEIAKSQDKLKLLGEVEGTERAQDSINKMTDAVKAFNEATSEAGKKSAYQQYNEAHADYNASYARAKQASQVANAEAKAEAQQVEQENQKIQQYYQSILDTVNKINGLDSKINEMKIKDGGTGLYSGVIQSLESDKSQLVDRLHQISNDINQEFQGIFTLTGDVKLPIGTFLDDLGNTPIPSTLSDFLNDTRTQAALTTVQMDKLIASFKNSQNIKFDFASKIVEQLKTAQQAMEQLQTISDPNNENAILSRDSAGYQQTMQAYQYLAGLQQSFGSDVSKWSSEQVAAFAKAAKAATDYANSTRQAAEQEAKYFAGKSKYKTGDTMYGDPNGALVKLGESAKNIDPAREKLANFVAEFTKGQGVITNFVTSANGISKVDFSTFDEATGQLRTFTAEMGKSTGNIFYDETSMKGLTAGTTAAKQSVESLSAAYEKLRQMSSSELDVSQYTSSAMSQIQKLNEALGSVGNSKDIGSQTMLKNMAAEANKTVQEIAKLEQGWLKVQAAIASGQAKQIGVADKSGNIEAQLTNMAQMSETARGATFAVQSFNAQTNTLTYTLTSANGTVKTMTAHMDQLTGSVVESAGRVSTMQTAWGQFANSFSGIGRKIKNYMSYMLSVHSIIRVFRNGIKSVLELDSALLELRKVTNATEETYSNFLNTMAQSGSKVGATMKDLTSSAADWARLGYSIQEAGKLAENTMVLMNVSEFTNVSEATDSLISAIQAFKTDGEDVGTLSTKIIDEMNEVGNNYAISTSDLADSLTRSSAALVAANNTLEESIALTTAANTTIQNPEAVGTALKTLSMRIRGVKTELEEAGEDTEGMVTNTAKLQDKILALTNIDGNGGIDILTNSGDFKSTYEILLEISKVWDKMSDTSQAALLELIAGKRAGSVVASIFQNGDILESAYESAQDSEGSSQRELNKYLDSIEGRIKEFKNASQDMWRNALNSDMIKGFVDLGTALVKVIDKFGLFKSALVGILFYMTAIKKNNPIRVFQDISARMYNLGVAKNQLGSITQMYGGSAAVSAMSMSQFNAGPVNAYAMAVQNLTAKQQAATLASAGLTKAQIQETMTKNNVTQANIEAAMSEAGIVTAKTQATTASIQEAFAAQGVTAAINNQAAADWMAVNSKKMLNVELLKEAVALGIITPETAAQMIATYGLAGANNMASASFQGLQASITSLMASNPIGWIMMIISAIMMLIMWIGNLGDKIQENFDAAINTIKEVSDSFNELKSSADTVIPRFTELARGVDRFGKNISLTDDEYNEFLSLNNQIAEMFPELKIGMDSNGNAMLSLAYNSDTLTESLWKLVEVERAAANQKIADSMPDIVKGIQQEVEAIKSENTFLTDRYKSLEKAKNKIEELYSFESRQNAQVEYGVDDWAYYWKDDIKKNHEDAINQALAEAFITDPDFFIDLKEQFTDEDGFIDWSALINSSEFQDEAAVLENQIDNVNDKISKKWNQLNSTVTAWVTTDDTYSSFSSDLQSVVNQMIGNIDFSKIEKQTAGGIKTYITDNILNTISQSSSEVKQKLIDLMKFDGSDLSLKEYGKQIRTMISDIADVSDFTKSDLLTMTGYGTILSDYENTAANILDILDNNIPQRYKQYEEGTKAHFNALNEYGIEIEALKEKIYSLSPSEVTQAFDIIKKYGISTWDELTYHLENKTFDVIVEYDAEAEGFEQLNQAMEESLTTSGLTAESILTLQRRYQDLEGYDPARLFEKTTQGIHLNAEALRELEKEYQDRNMKDFETKIDGLKEAYNNLTEDINNTSDAAERANLYAQRDNIIDQINDTAELASQYAGLTSAYKQWQDIQSGGTERDMYEGILEGKEEIEEELSRGWADEGTRAYLELLSGQDLSTASIEELLTLYRQLDETINGAGYGVNDFFTQDDDGNSTSEGIFNFLDTVKAAQEELKQSGEWAEKGFTKDWVTIDENGNYSFDFTTSGGNEVIADALGISEELVDILVKAAQDAGFEINMDSAYSDLAGFEDKAVEVNDRLKELGATEYTFNINSTDLEHVETQIEEADTALKNLKNEDGTLKVGVTEEDVKNAQTLLATLIYQKQTLEKPVILSVDTTGAEEGSVESAIQKLIDFKAAYNDLEVKAAVGADTTEAETNLNTAITTLQNTDPKILADLGIDPTQSAADINAAILAMEEQTLIDLEVKLHPATGEEGSTTEGQVIWENNIDAVTTWAGEAGAADRTAEGTVTWGNETFFNTSTPLTINVDDSQVDAAKTNIDGIPETESTSYDLTGTGAQEVSDLNTDVNGISETESTSYDVTGTGAQEVADINTGLGNIPAIEMTSYSLAGTGQTAVQAIQSEWVDIEKDKETTYTVHQQVISEGGEIEPEGESKHVLQLKPKDPLKIAPEDLPPLPEDHFSNNSSSKHQLTLTPKKALPDAGFLNLELAYKGIGVLKDIQELQGVISETSEGVTIIDEDGLVNVFKNAEYTEEEIQKILDMVNEFNNVQFSAPEHELELIPNKTLPESGFLDLSLAYEGVDALKDIQELQSAISETGDGTTIINEDAFKNILKNSEYTEEEIQMIIDRIKEYNDVCTLIPDDPLDLSNTEIVMPEFTEILDEFEVGYNYIHDMFGNPIGINIESKDLVTVLTEKGWTVEQISAYLQTLSSTENGLGITIDGKVDMNKEEIDAAIAAAGNIPETESVQLSVTGTGASILDNALDDAKALDGKKVNTYLNTYKTTYSSSVGGPSPANGTAHAQGTAFNSGSWGASKTETALVGELGPELLVRNGRWTTIGENGAEFTGIRKGDIIFNHKQTEDLLKNGYVTGRGKAYAEGTAFSSGIGPGRFTVAKTSLNGQSSAASKLSNAADKVSKSADKFEEVFDWIEVRLEEINEELDLKNAKLENSIGSNKQNAVIDDMIELNHKLYDNLIVGAEEYHRYAKALLEKVPAQYREAAQDGTIAIEKFAGDAGEKTLEAIENYREWVQKGADATQQAEEVLTEISSLAKQAIDNIASDYENKTSMPNNRIEQLEAYNDLLETDVGFESSKVYQAIIDDNKQVLDELTKQRNDMQTELNKHVEAGNIKKYSQDWYDAVNDIAAVDTEIIELKTDNEDLQDSINELHWDQFDLFITKLEAVSEEADNLIDILENSDVADELGNWTDEGITSLGLYAQQMEAAEFQAKQYREEIDYLNKNWKKLGYTEEEYIEKLDDLKSGQYDAIQAYHDAKDAIVDLNSERVEAIKDGIQKEIDAYTELIEKKKEELSAEKDLYDFQKSIMEQEKDIADIQRQLAALSGDNSASARAKRAQLEAELAQANAALEDTYYNRSVTNQQEALDKELENFKDAKDKEIEGWEEYLENTELVVSDSLTTIQANTDTVYKTLSELGQEYSLSITESLTSPWTEGTYAIQEFSEQFGLSMSATVEELKALELEFTETMLEIEQAGVNAVETVKNSTSGYTSAEYKEPPKPEEPKEEQKKEEEQKKTTPSVGDQVKVKKTAKRWGSRSSNKRMASWVPGSTFTVAQVFSDGQAVIGKKKKNGKIAYTGTINITDLEGYATGTTGVKKDQWALIDELGEELVIRPNNGRLTFMEKGTGVVPADLTANLMEWGELDPQDVLNRNRPSIGVSPSVVNNTMQINVDASVGTLLHVEEFNGDDPAEVVKIVNKALDKHMQNLNNKLKGFAR